MALKFRREKGGPGKFEGEGAATEVLHHLSLDGGDEEYGDVSEDGAHWTKMKGPFLLEALEDDDCVKILEERAVEDDLFDLAAATGAILEENDHGFVTAEFFYDEKGREIDAEWDDIVANGAGTDDEDEEPDPDALCKCGCKYEDHWEDGGVCTKCPEGKGDLENCEEFEEDPDEFRR